MAISIKAPKNKRPVVAALVWCATYFASILILKHLKPTGAAGVITAVVPILTFVYFIYTYIKAIGTMDEVKQRIHFEAAVVGFALALMLMMALFLLAMADIFNYDYFGYSYMVLYFIAFYYIGYIRAVRKYGK